MTKTPTVYFMRVVDNDAKLNRLCEVVHKHFINTDRILISVPTPQAAAYVDQLLWKMPKESFTPHLIANAVTNERVAITTGMTNVNKANILVNLNTNVPSLINTVEIVYELFDLTSPEKEKASEARQAIYADTGISFHEHPTN
ncbi:MAG: DNA polymerase III subunit chi [Parachlamydiaceae bacterium]